MVLPAIFSQHDERWKKEKLGTSLQTLDGYGCLVTVMAMLCRYYGKDTDPGRLNKSLVGINAYQDQNLYKWYEGVPKLYGDIQVSKIKDTPFNLTSVHWAEIDAELKAGRPVVCEVDFDPDPDVDMHFVLIIDGANGEYQCADPWYGDIASIRRYGEPKVTIQKYVFHSGPIPQQKTELEIVKEQLATTSKNLEEVTAKYEADKKNWATKAEYIADIEKANEGLSTANKSWEEFFEKAWGTLNPIGKDKNTANFLSELAELITTEDQHTDLLKKWKDCKSNYADFVKKVKEAASIIATDEDGVIEGIKKLVANQKPTSTTPPEPEPEPKKEHLIIAIIRWILKLGR